MMSTDADLHAYLGRLLGWSSPARIDDALQSLELAQEGRAQLLLCGPGDLVPFAYGLHRRAFGDDTPFVVCDPRRRDTPATVRAPANFVDPTAAFEAALGGSLCIRRRRPPKGFGALVGRLRDTDSVQYICLDNDCLQWLVRPGPIEIPALSQRLGDLPRIVDECMLEASRDLLATPVVLAPRDRNWLLEHGAEMSLSEVEKAVLRIVALRTSATLTSAATRLGMAAVSLSRWASRRRLASAP